MQLRGLTHASNLSSLARPSSLPPGCMRVLRPKQAVSEGERNAELRVLMRDETLGLSSHGGGGGGDGGDEDGPSLKKLGKGDRGGLPVPDANLDLGGILMPAAFVTSAALRTGISGASSPSATNTLSFRALFTRGVLEVRCQQRARREGRGRGQQQARAGVLKHADRGGGLPRCLYFRAAQRHIYRSCGCDAPEKTAHIHSWR